MLSFYMFLNLILGICVSAINVQCIECINQLSLANLQQLQELSVPSRLKPTGSLLKPILRTRVSGTANNTLVRQFIEGELKKINWHVELDTFKAETPIGEIEFTNVIGVQNPAAKRHLVFAAHFDSKLFEGVNSNFVAATDSAVSCALLLDLAISLNSMLEKKKGEVGLKLIFFDGEEAFEQWSETDSIYGARHLASKWHGTPLSRRIRSSNLNETELDSIELFVLLDLLGSDNTPLISLNSETRHFFNKMIQLESKLFQYSLKPNSLRQRQFQNYEMSAHIDDDHRPFMERGVSILHLIPVPFPKFWHTIKDDETVISAKVVNHLALLFRAFVAEYLCLFQ